MKTTKKPFGIPFGKMDTPTQPQIVPQQDPKKQNLTQGRSKENETFPYITKDR